MDVWEQIRSQNNKSLSRSRKKGSIRAADLNMHEQQFALCLPVEWGLKSHDAVWDVLFGPEPEADSNPWHRRKSNTPFHPARRVPEGSVARSGRTIDGPSSLQMHLPVCSPNQSETQSGQSTWRVEEEFGFYWLLSSSIWPKTRLHTSKRESLIPFQGQFISVFGNQLDVTVVVFLSDRCVFWDPKVNNC